MSTPHAIKDFWRGDGPKAGKMAKWLNQVAQFLNLIEAADPIQVEFTGSSIRITMADGYSAIPDPPDTGFWQLTSLDGTVSWKQVLDCNGNPVTDASGSGA